MHAKDEICDPEWTLWHANADIWPAILGELEEARHSITVEQFILSRYGIGARLMDVLTSAARRGVDVRVLADGFGSFGLEWSSGARSLRQAGGRVELFDSFTDVARNPLGRIHRLHRKTVTRDGCVAITGGACYHDRMSGWRDTMIRIEGGTVPRVAADVFEQLWARAVRRRSAPAPAQTPPGKTPKQWAYMLSTPVKPAERELWDTLHARIEGAEREITLTTPYLVPDNRFRRAINRAAERGVDVRIILPETSDHLSMDVLGRQFARRLRSRGARIHFYQPSMIHAKLALIDGAWGSVSSFNLDILSFWTNLESGVVGTDPAFCDALAAQLDRDLHNSVRF